MRVYITDVFERLRTEFARVQVTNRFGKLRTDFALVEGFAEVNVDVGNLVVLEKG